MSPVCTKLAWLATCSTGNHEGAVAQADNVNSMRWKGTVSRDLQDYELSFEEATVVAQDRKEWWLFALALCGSAQGSNKIL